MRCFSKVVAPILGKPSAEDVFREQAEYVHKLLEDLALDQEPMAIAKAPELLVIFQEEQKRQEAGFAFSCTRTGDFLTINIERSGNPAEGRRTFFGWQDSEQAFGTTINLRHIDTMQLIPGSAANSHGVLRYGYMIASDHKDGGTTLGGTNFGNYLPSPGSHYEVRAHLPKAPYCRDMFQIVAPRVRAEDVIDLGRYNYKIQFTTPNYPAPSVDDRIVFPSLNATLYAPCGRGADVMQQIMSATCATSQSTEGVRRATYQTGDISDPQMGELHDIQESPFDGGPWRPC